MPIPSLQQELRRRVERRALKPKLRTRMPITAPKRMPGRYTLGAQPRITEAIERRRGRRAGPPIGRIGPTGGLMPFGRTSVEHLRKPKAPTAPIRLLPSRPRQPLRVTPKLI